MEKTPVYLIFVDPDNNGSDSNKEYSLNPLGDGTFKAEWGRVGGHHSSKIYPISDWDKILNSKLKKGYVERTNFMTEVIEDSKENSSNNGMNEFDVIPNISVRAIIRRLYDYANNVIQSAYRVSAGVVTQAMVDAAQAQIDFISNNYESMGVEEFNKELIKLFQIIPRKMQKVSFHLASDSDKFENIISREQDTLDAMAGQVYKPIEKKVTVQTNADTISILDKMGITMDDIDANDEKIIKKLLSKESEGRFVKAWRVTNLKSDERFKKYCEDNHITNKKLFFHGTRSQNVFSILRNSLLLKPSNVIINGKMFGFATYMASRAKKSIGYTSVSGSYWARGGDSRGYLIIFETAYGKPYDIYTYNSSYSQLTKERLALLDPTANCVHAHAGASIINDEIMFYDEAAVNMKYLVEIK